MAGSQNNGNHIPDDMIRLGKTIEDIAEANRQVDTDIHMVSDSIDIMADTSDSLSEYTIYLKENADRLKEASKSGASDLQDIVDVICEIVGECNSLLFDFVEMSHGIQNVVRSIANDVDEITEATKEVSEAFKEVVEETTEND
jgi:methyl-accepting chemotaxis protein